MKGKVVWFAFTIIVMVVLLGASLIWTAQAKPAESFEELWKIGEGTGISTEPSPDLPLPPNPFGSFEDIEVERTISDVDGPHRLSEVSCAIANDIWEDFKRNGKSALRVNSEGETIVCASGRPSNKDQCLVGVGTFNYQKGTTSPPSSWEVDLSDEYPGCHVCPIEDLDEVCINYNLKDRTRDSEKLCEGALTTPQGDARFGNCDCGDNRNSGVSGWNDQCDGWKCVGACWCDGPIFDGTWCHCGNDYINDFCDNNEDMITWVADTDGTEKWKVKDNRDDSYNSRVMSEGHQYIYGVFWVPDKERYYVLFYRVPQTGDGGTSFDFISNLLGDFSMTQTTGFYRMNAIGNQYKEARTIADVEVTLANPISVQQLKTQIASATGLNIEDKKIPCIDNCDGESCIPDTPITLTQRKCGVAGVGAGVWHFFLEPVTIYTDATSCTGEFLAGKTYRVIIQNWWGKYESDDGSNSVDCFESYQKSVSIIETGGDSEGEEETVIWTLEVQGVNPGTLCIGSDCAANIGIPSNPIELTEGQFVTVVADPDDPSLISCLVDGYSGTEICSRSIGFYSSTGPALFDSTIAVIFNPAETWDLIVDGSTGGSLCVESLTLRGEICTTDADSVSFKKWENVHIEARPDSGKTACIYPGSDTSSEICAGSPGVTLTIDGPISLSGPMHAVFH